VLLVVVLGLLAAALLAVSASAQQWAASRAAATEAATNGTDGGARGGANGGARGGARLRRALPVIGLLGTLVRSPLWAYGQLVNLLGVVVQASALHLGSVALVQPLIASQLLFALPLGSVGRRRWPMRRDWLAAGAIVLGITLFLAVPGAAPQPGRADRHRVILAALSALVVVTLIVVTAVGRRPPLYGTLLAVGGGLCSAVSAVFLKLTVDDLVHRGVAATAVDWPGYALAFSTACSLVLTQQAFASGSLAPALAAGTATSTVTSYVLGILAFHAAPPATAGTLTALTAAGLMLVAGIVGLAYSPSMRPGPPRPAAVRRAAWRPRIG
jgi:hypothetical protein